MLVTIATVSTEEFFVGYILTRSTSVQLTPVIFTSAPDESGDEELTFPRHAAPGENLFLREMSESGTHLAFYANNN